MKIYLCGPIQGCTDMECKEWRGYVAGLARQLGFETCDPMRRDYRGIEFDNYREVVELDKRDVESCDFVLVNYAKPSVGTSMEIYHAWLKGVPVVVVCQANAAISPWLRYHTTRFCHTFGAAVDWIKGASL
jgi:nucleoside 2-deoxyribosyltransferase